MHDMHADGRYACVCTRCMHMHEMHSYARYACICIICMHMHGMHAYACICMHMHAYARHAAYACICTIWTLKAALGSQTGPDPTATLPQPYRTAISGRLTKPGFGGWQGATPLPISGGAYYACISCICMHIVHMHACRAYACISCMCMHMHAYRAYACIMCICMHIVHMHAYRAYACISCICMHIVHIVYSLTIPQLFLS